MMKRKAASYGLLFHAGLMGSIPTGSPSYDDIVTCDIHEGNQAFIDAWPQVLPTESYSVETRLLILGQVWMESRFGLHTGSMKGTNNWGAVNATSEWMKRKGNLPGFGRFKHGDTNQQGQGYVTWFRQFPNQFEAAKDWLEFMTGTAAKNKRLPELLQVWKSGDPSTYATYLYNVHYYTGTTTDRATNIRAYTEFLTGGKATIRSHLAKTCSLSLPSPTPSIPPEPVPPSLPQAPISPFSSLSFPKPTSKQGAALLLGFSALLYATDSLFLKDHDS